MIFFHVIKRHLYVFYAEVYIQILFLFIFKFVVFWLFKLNEFFLYKLNEFFFSCIWNYSILLTAELRTLTGKIVTEIESFIAILFVVSSVFLICLYSGVHFVLFHFNIIPLYIKFVCKPLTLLPIKCFSEQ